MSLKNKIIEGSIIVVVLIVTALSYYFASHLYDYI